MASAHFDDADGGFLQQIGRALVERASAGACLLTASGDSGTFFLVAAGKASGLDAAALGPRVADLLAGRGGGAGPVFQGKAGSLEKRDEALALLRGEPAPPAAS